MFRIRSGAYKPYIALLCAVTCLAGRPRACLFQHSEIPPRNEERKPLSLDTIYTEGVYAMASGHWKIAEQRFLSVLFIDAEDWDARERLAVLYQRENRLRERDIQLEYLREALEKGGAWRDYIWRDQFIFKRWRIMAVETPARAADRKRKFLFAVSDSGNGRFLYLVTMMHRAPKAKAGTATESDSPRNFETEVQSGNRRKVYRFQAQEARYSDSVRILERFLEGI